MQKKKRPRIVDGKDSFYRKLNLAKEDWEILNWLRAYKSEMLYGKNRKGGEYNDKMES